MLKYQAIKFITNFLTAVFENTFAINVVLLLIRIMYWLQEFHLLTVARRCAQVFLGGKTKRSMSIFNGSLENAVRFIADVCTFSSA